MLAGDLDLGLRAGDLLEIEVPTDAGTSIHREWLLIRPRSDWTVGDTTYVAGTLLAAQYDEYLSGARDLAVVFTPDEHTSLDAYTWTRDRLILVTLADVVSRVEVVTPGTWTREPVVGLPPNTSVSVVAADEYGDEVFYDSSGFDTPSRLL